MWNNTLHSLEAAKTECRQNRKAAKSEGRQAGMPPNRKAAQSPAPLLLLVLLLYLPYAHMTDHVKYL